MHRSGTEPGGLLLLSGRVLLELKCKAVEVQHSKVGCVRHVCASSKSLHWLGPLLALTATFKVTAFQPSLCVNVFSAGQRRSVLVPLVLKQLGLAALRPQEGFCCEIDGHLCAVLEMQTARLVLSKCMPFYIHRFWSESNIQSPIP